MPGVTEAPVAHEAPLDNPLVEHLSPEAELYEALVLGTRDYCAKNGFSDVVIGLSGGIDSTLVAVIAAAALGPEHVHGVSMPSRYSSEHSKSDAALLAAAIVSASRPAIRAALREFREEQTRRVRQDSLP